MSQPIKVFISYKTSVDEGLTKDANAIRKLLLGSGFDVWMDQDALIGGRPWNQQIYDEIPERDVLLLLLSGQTDQSEWVRREVDIARGARIQILPVLIRGNFEVSETLDKLDLSKYQYIDYRLGNEKQDQDLIGSIQKLISLSAKDNNKKTFTVAVSETPVKSANTQYATFQYKLNAAILPCKIHIAVGDMTKARNIDVIVNSENPYLEMGSIFKGKSVSALLRYYGSYIDEGGKLAEDTLQNELEAAIKGNVRLTRPLGIGTVIATSAGHPLSILRSENRTRYIFHTITVAVVGEGDERTAVPDKGDTSLRRATIKTLEKIIEVNNKKGVISPPGTGIVLLEDPKNKGSMIEEDEFSRQTNQKNYRPIESIIIPLFASGHGGRSPAEVMRPIIEGISDFLQEIHDHREEAHVKETYETLKHIHLSVFYKEYVETMRAMMKEYFDETTPPLEVIE